VNVMKWLRNWWRRHENRKPRRVTRLLELAALDEALARVEEQQQQRAEQDGTGNAGSAALADGE
jgi:hypothetical protein